MPLISFCALHHEENKMQLNIAPKSLTQTAFRS